MFCPFIENSMVICIYIFQLTPHNIVMKEGGNEIR